MSDLLNIGLSGLHASKTNLTVTGHNITNVNTPGYTRQDTVQVAGKPQLSGAGYIGTGTSLTDIRRSYNEFLTTQVRTTTALNSDVTAYKSQIDQMDGLLASQASGVNPALQSFFAASQTAAEDPANMPARQLVLAEAEGLSRRFNSVYDTISAQNNVVNKQMASSAEQVNRLAQTIGRLNASISSAQGHAQQPNDLLDARDEAVRELSTYIGVTVVVQDDNSYNLSVGSGQPLVTGNTVNQLQAVPEAGNPNKLNIEFVSGHSRQNISQQISGGEIGGLLRFREEVLDPTLNSIGRLAIAVNVEVNSQLGQGLDLKGQAGSALFNDINASNLTGLRVRPMGGNDSAANVGGDLHISNSQLLTASDYRVDFDGNNYSARRLSDGAPISVTLAANGDMSFADSAGRDQGIRLQLNATPAAGDSFILEPTRRGAADIATVLDQADQLAFAAPLTASSDLQNKGTASVTQPSLDRVLDPASLPQTHFVGAELSLPHLQALGEIGMRYDPNAGTQGTGALLFNTPLPAGVTITAVPVEGQAAPGAINSLDISAGKNNQLSYAIEVDVGGSKQSYSITQNISGRPQAGDQFSVNFNQNGVSDNRNALKLADLQSQQLVGVDANVTAISTGMSFTDSYGDTVERVGTLTAQARQDDVATGALLQQATDSRNSLSAVNLDEEAANLIKYEQYYNASAQVIQVARSLFDTLMSTFR